MKIFALGAIDAAYTEAAGGKARGLDRLIKEGLRVPPGFVLTDIDTESDLDAAADCYLSSGLLKVAVRSSATAEDGAEFSYAGQFKTVLNVAGAGAFKDAVRECLGSLESGPGKSYSGRFGGQNVKMSVVVQQMVGADCAGVCFTADPADAGSMLIEAVEGLGEALVSGVAQAERYRVPRDCENGEGLEALCAGQKLLTPQTLREIAFQAKRTEEAFGVPLDTEWAIKDGTLYWLQARPITVLETCAEDEFDPKEDLSGNVITRCNVGEMLPGPVTPLTLSVSVYAIDWGLRKMLCVAGANPKMKTLAPMSCLFSVSGHLFFNLSPIYRMEKTTLLANKRNIDMSLCGRALEEETSISLGGKPGFFKRLHNTFKYISFILSRNKARRELAALAGSLTVGENETTAEGLYNAIDAAKGTADYSLYLHYVTSSHSGAMSSAAIEIFNKKFRDPEKSKAVLAELLEGIDGIESVDILKSLRRVVRAVLKDNPAAADYGAEELAAYMKTAGDSVSEARAEFMKRHGHRAVREAELRNKGWAGDEKAFTEHLRTVILGGAEDSETSAAPDIKAVIRKYGFKGINAGILAYLAKQSREGAKIREYSKSKMIIVLDAFKRAYSRLAAMLVREGRLPDEDAVYFLTHREIGGLIKGENPGLSKKALQRRRLLKAQWERRFSEVYTSNPQPLPPVVPAEAGEILKGAPISRGTAVGAARVVRGMEDAAELRKGEIMVAAYTDIGWSPFYCLIEGLVTEVGSALSHGAVVAREYALPFVANVAGATSLIRTGDMITVDGFTGCVTRH